VADDNGDGDKRVTVTLPAAPEKETALVDRVADQIEAVEPGDTEVHLDVMVLRAQIAYMTDSERRPPDAFYPVVARHMTITAYYHRVRDGRWREAREQLWARAQRRLVERLSGQVVEQRVREMEQLTSLREHYLDLITPDEVEVVNEDTGLVERHRRFKVEPKSLGEAVRSFKDLTLLLEMTRRNVFGELDNHVPAVEMQNAEEAGGAGDYFSQDELAELAHGLLKRRSGLDDGNN